MLNQFFKINAERPAHSEDLLSGHQYSRYSIYLTIGVCLLVILLTGWLLKDFLTMIIMVSLIGLILGNLVPGWHQRLVLKSGAFLIITIMAILGLRLKFDQMNIPLTFILIVVGWLLIHYLVMILIAKKLNISKQRWNNYKSGKHDMPENVIDNLCEQFGLDKSDLVVIP